MPIFVDTSRTNADYNNFKSNKKEGENVFHSEASFETNDNNINNRKIDSIEELFLNLCITTGFLLLKVALILYINYLDKTENTYNPRARRGYNVYTNNNINMTATDALNILKLTNKDINTLTLKEINTAYRKNALKYHPDKNKAPEAAEKFRKMTEARDFLLEYIKKN